MASKNSSIKNPQKLFPLILTSKLEQTKAFYFNVLGFRLVFDRPVYVQLAYGAGDGPELCFMKPDAFPDGERRPAFDGNGVFVSIPTPDADEKYQQLVAAGAEVLSKPDDKPWGWRSFLLRDPNGLVLDFFHVYKEVSPDKM
jgi:catechol 2,3-dioxygenase-like lactoylglutathione lyase family enzyme